MFTLHNQSNESAPSEFVQFPNSKSAESGKTCQIGSAINDGWCLWSNKRFFEVVEKCTIISKRKKYHK